MFHACNGVTFSLTDVCSPAFDPSQLADIVNGNCMGPDHYVLEFNATNPTTFEACFADQSFWTAEQNGYLGPVAWAYINLMVDTPKGVFCQCYGPCSHMNRVGSRFAPLPTRAPRPMPVCRPQRNFPTSSPSTSTSSPTLASASLPCSASHSSRAAVRRCQLDTIALLPSCPWCLASLAPTDPRSTLAADLCCCAKVSDDEATAQLTYERGKPPQGAYIARP